MLTPQRMEFTLPYERPEPPRRIEAIFLPIVDERYYKKTLIDPIPLPQPKVVKEVESREVLQVAYTPRQLAVTDISNINVDWLTPRKVYSKDTEGPNKRYYTTEEQKMIAAKLGLKVSGSKGEVYDRIIQKLKEVGRI